MSVIQRIRPIVARVATTVALGALLCNATSPSTAMADTLSPAVEPNDPRISYSLSLLQPDLTQPIFVTHAGDDRLFIVLQEGSIVISQNGTLLPADFLNVSGLVQCCGEEGLLGLAFEPNYATTGRFYVYYTNNSGDQVIARYNVSGANPNVADPGSAQIILTIPHPNESNHNGGWIGFGPDNNLYAGVGDGGGAGDPNCTGQNPNELRGKILRLNVVGQATYTSPTGNVFTVTQRPEVWAYGLRNPWRNSFDRQTGEMYIADVGQGAIEEVNYLPANAPAGADFGWSTYEGRQLYNNPCPNKTAGVAMPVADYGHSLGCSITGGYAYRGAKYPFISGAYFYGDFCSGRMWVMWRPPATTTFTTTLALDTSYNISSFGEDASGELYVVDHGCYGSSCTPAPRQGAVYRLIATDPLGARVALPMIRKPAGQ